MARFAAIKSVLTSTLAAVAIGAVPAVDARADVDGTHGAVFGNRERQLPIQERGTCRDHTATSPGSRDRGARRIVCGGPPGTPHACDDTADRYASFPKIVE